MFQWFNLLFFKTNLITLLGSSSNYHLGNNLLTPSNRVYFIKTCDRDKLFHSKYIFPQENITKLQVNVVTSDLWFSIKAPWKSFLLVCVCVCVSVVYMYVAISVCVCIAVYIRPFKCV